MEGKPYVKQAPASKPITDAFRTFGHAGALDPIPGQGAARCADPVAERKGQATEPTPPQTRQPTPVSRVPRPGVPSAPWKST